MPRSAPRPSAALVHTRNATSIAANDPLLAEALRLAEHTRNTVEDALVEFGRWLLVHVFESDAAAALSDRTHNPLWTELLRRAGGPSLRLSRRFLHVAVAIAAHDKRINDDTWRLLEPGRKELLLPLGDEKLMRKAATHVMKLKLSLRLTRQYVKTLRENTPQEKQTRLAPAQLRGQVTRFLGRVEDEGFEKRLHATVKGMTDEERKELASQAAALRAFAERLSRVARGKEVG